MKHQALFSSKDKNKKIKVSSAAILLGDLRGKGKIQHVQIICYCVTFYCAIIVHWVH